MIVMLGDTRHAEMLETIRARHWGRMCCASLPRPYPGEPWGYDNGAFTAWRKGVRWDSDAYLRRVERVTATGRTPMLAVVPDLPAQGQRSLDFSVAWLPRLPETWPRYLAVQDGMTPQAVLDVLDLGFAGLFLGGTDRFKLEAAEWCALAHGNDRFFHYARAGTRAKVEHAQRVGADSMDSSFPLWTRRRFAEFAQWIEGTHPQQPLAGLPPKVREPAERAERGERT